MTTKHLCLTPLQSTTTFKHQSPKRLLQHLNVIPALIPMLLFLLLGLCSISLKANTENATFNQEIEQVIVQTLQKVNTATQIDQVQEGVNQLERIAMAVPDRWEVHYHLAYSRIMLSFWEPEAARKDQLLDRAEEALQKAETLKANPSEWHTLQAFIYQARIAVDGSRGMNYSRKADKSLEQALKHNPDNPRALYLKGQNVLNTPAMFGGGSKKALPWFEKAVQNFEGQAENEGLNPNWGKGSAQHLLQHCKAN